MDNRDVFMKYIKELYGDFHKRIDVQYWKELFNSDIFTKEGMIKKVEYELLSFLQNNYYLPHEIWSFLNNFFGWSNNKDKLCKEFPKEFINFIISYSENELYIRYNMFPKNISMDYDKFIEIYIKACNEFKKGNIIETRKAIYEAREVYSDHIDLKILFIKYKKLKNEIDRVIELCNYILEENGDEQEVYIIRADCFLEKGKLEKAYNDYKKAFEIGAVKFENFYNMGYICFLLGKFQEIKEYLDYYELEERYKILKDIDKKIGLNCEFNRIMAEYCADLNKNEEGLAYGYKAIVLMPYNPKSYILQGEILCKLNRYDDSLDLYNTALKLSDEKSEILSHKGKVLYLMGLYKESIQCCTEALKEKNIISAYSTRIKSFCALDQYGDALDDCEKIIKIDSYNIESYRSKVNIYNEIKLYHEAIEICDIAFRIGIINSELLYEKAKAMYYLGMKKETVEICKDIIKENVDFDEAYYLMGKIYEDEKDYKKALGNYKIALDKNPYKSHYMICIAKVYEIMKDNEKVLQYYTQIIKITKEDNEKLIIDGYANRGNYYSKIGRRDEAIEDYSKIIELDPTNLKAYEFKSILYVKAGKYYDAIEGYKKIIELDNSNYNAHVKIGECYQKVNKFYEAIEYLENAIKIERKLLDAYKIRAICFYNIKKYEECIKDLEFCIKSKDLGNDEIAHMFNYIAYAYKQMGKINEALECYEEAMLYDRDNKILIKEYEELQKQTPILSKIIGVFGKKK